MPEGPEVETVRRTLEPLVEGRRLGAPWVSRHKLRTPTTKRALAAVTDRRVTGTGRHGKLLWLDVEGGGGLMVRLGMTGRLVVEARDAPRHPHTHVVIPLDDGAQELRYVDVRRFGEVVPYKDAKERDEERARMGPDPLTWTPEERARVKARLRSTTRTLKDALLDQSLLAGVGNIYASEALFVARLSPFKRGCDTSPRALERLLDAVQEVLEKAVVHRGTTFSDFVDSTGGEGGNLEHLLVFQREGEPCPSCGRGVEREVQGARSTFFCPRCQR